MVGAAAKISGYDPLGGRAALLSLGPYQGVGADKSDEERGGHCGRRPPRVVRPSSVLSRAYLTMA